MLAEWFMWKLMECLFHGFSSFDILTVMSGGRAEERQTVNRGDGGSIPPTSVSKLRQFRSPHICLCLSEETLKAGGPSIWYLCQGK